MSAIPAIDQGSFEREVLLSNLPVILEFGAPWCRPCKTLEPLLIQLAEEWSGKVRLLSIDVDQNPDLTARLGILGVPTVILFSRGKELDRFTGSLPRDRIVARFVKKL